MHTKEEVVAALTDYQNGVAHEEIARRYGINKGTIWSWAKKAGIVRKKIGHPPRNWDSIKEELKK